MLLSTSTFSTPSHVQRNLGTAQPLLILRPVSHSRSTSQLRVTVSAETTTVSADVAVTASSIEGSVIPAKIPWHKKPCGFKEVTCVEELQAAISTEHNDGRMSVVDFYAGWCASCKSSFPALCRIPNDDFLSQHFNFYKANIEEGDFASFIRKKGVRGIPYVLVFDAEGSDLIGMSASFKKMEQLRKNLEFIARADVKDFVLDPNGLVVNR